MRKVRVLAVIVCAMAAVNFASADTIQGINIDFVTIGNAGNVADNSGWGYGAVGYNYRIGKYEVTNSQWNTFTAVAGAPTGNPSDAYDESAHFTGDQQPTNKISWYEAAQFCNYLTSGDKDLGAYQLGTDGSIVVDRDAAVSAFGITYVIPTQNEWYKAAYYKPDASGYSLYANGTNTAPIAGVESNYDMAIGAPWDITNGTQEQNGTFDMMGNIWEWNETLISPPSSRRILGGCFYSGSIVFNSADWGDISIFAGEINENNDIGFRVIEIPEPASAAIMTLGGLLFALKRRKR